MSKSRSDGAGRLFSLPVLPTQLIPLSEEELSRYKKKYNELNQQEGFYAEERHIPINDQQGQLEAVVAAPEKNPRAIIIHVRGNAEKFQEAMTEMVQDAKNENAVVVGFNPRGVYQSGGYLYGKQNLVDDLQAVFKVITNDPRYKDLPVIIKAHSIGGSYTAEWAAQLNVKNARNVQLLWLGRTFSHIEKTVAPNQGLLNRLTQSVLSFAGWRIAPAEVLVPIKTKNIPVVAIDAEAIL